MIRSKNDPLPSRARASSLELAKTLYKIPALLTIHTRCGKPNCRCTRGELHGPYHALHWREGPTQRRRYVKARDVAAVRAVIDRRRAERARLRFAFAADLALLCRLDRLRRDLDAAVAEERSDR
jgi:uncharacterized protein DUF6788